MNPQLQALITPDNIRRFINYFADAVGGWIWTAGVFGIILIILNYVGKCMVAEYENTNSKKRARKKQCGNAPTAKRLTQKQKSDARNATE